MSKESKALLRELKTLLLQMKLDQNYEMRIIAEETIVNEYDDLIASLEKERAKSARLLEALKFYAAKDTWMLSGSLSGKRYFMNLKNYGDPMNDFNIYKVPNSFGFAHEPKELEYYIAGKLAREAIRDYNQSEGGEK